MNSFCTIITYNHIPWALTLYESLLEYDQNVNFVILIVDKKKNEVDTKYFIEKYDVICIEDLNLDEVGFGIIEKYKNDLDRLRWCLKSILLEQCLLKYETVIYCDSDVYFVNEYQFLIDSAKKSSLILTPHWRSSVANIDISNFELLFVGGLYNAGFVGASRAGIPALKHWAKNCLHICYKDFSKGFCDDQTHLNLLPVYFENIKIIKHRGCNVANWNQIECKRTYNLDTKEVAINDEYEIIFIHFTKSTITGILEGKDKLLRDYFEKFSRNLTKNGGTY